MSELLFSKWQKVGSHHSLWLASHNTCIHNVTEQYKPVLSYIVLGSILRLRLVFECFFCRIIKMILLNTCFKSIHNLSFIELKLLCQIYVCFFMKYPLRWTITFVQGCQIIWRISRRCVKKGLWSSRETPKPNWRSCY